MAKRISRRSFVGFAGAGFGTAFLAACSNGQETATDVEETTEDVAGEATKEASATAAIDYMALVNKQHKLPSEWETNVELVEAENLLGDNPIEVERKAYEAWQGLKEDLAAEGVNVELDSCYRSVASQQEIMDEFTVEYGAEYAKRIVATPGYSEHHTGLALDLYLVIDGENVFENEEMMKQPEIWEKVHAKLADHGFILRYLPERKLFTGYSYEPWHIRYIDDPQVAAEIMGDGLTFEEYLGEVQECVAGCEIDYGTSDVFAEADIDSTIDAIMAEFSTWTGCVLTRLAYAGDDACGSEEVAYVNELREAGEQDLEEFAEAIVISTDFHSPSPEDAEGTAWEPDTDYEGYTWHLGRRDVDDAWHLMTWGYA